MNCRKFFVLGGLLLPLLLGAQAVPTPQAAEEGIRLKDLVRVEGLRENQLTGIGLVTGLAGQGDSSSSPLLQYTLSSLLANNGISLPPEVIKSKNAAVVALTIQVPSYLRPGDRLDVQISSLGDAKNLEGGILIQAPLMGANGQVYAVAQGKISTPMGAKSSKTTGIITKGALAERGITSQYLDSRSITFLLNDPDFSTASEIVKVLRENFPDLVFNVTDPARISAVLDDGASGDPVGFMAKAENLRVVPDFSSKVVVDKSNGVVVMGRFVRIAKVALSVKGAKVSVGSVNSFGEGSEQFSLDSTSTVEDLVTLLQQIGLDTDTVIEVLKGIEKAGALYGTLEIR